MPYADVPYNSDFAQVYHCNEEKVLKPNECECNGPIYIVPPPPMPMDYPPCPYPFPPHHHHHHHPDEPPLPKASVEA